MTRKKRGRRSKKRGRKGRTPGRGPNRVERRLADFLILGVLLLAAYFAVFGGEFSIFEIKRLEALQADRAAELARTRARIDSLQQVVDKLRRDEMEIERVARERYGMIRDGEILYRFREPEDTLDE